MRVFSFGGGVQSTAVLVLAAQGKVQYDQFLFANVGADSENPETLMYYECFAVPFAFRHGIPLLSVAKTLRDGTVDTLLGRVLRERRSVSIPARMSNGAPGNRTCTGDFKIKVIAKWQKEHGATASNPTVTGLGISVDELHRARTDSGIPWQTLEYPLLDLRLNRSDCQRIIAEAGLPVPAKSSCWFCPFKTYGEWQRMRRDKPALFNQAAALEATLGDRMESIGRDRVWLTQYCRPMAGAVSGDQLTMDDYLDTCDSGYCFT